MNKSAAKTILFTHLLQKKIHNPRCHQAIYKHRLKK